MPNTEKLIKLGAAREDLAFLGNVPNITPPMWTTLATGATPLTHGITCFWRQSKERLDEISYNLDSRNCHAEQVWNVLAESGYKTLVWNWPGSSWPPSSDSENLHVVDGTSPGSVNTANAQIDSAKITVADITITDTVFRASAPVENGAGCILKDVPIEEATLNITEQALSPGGVINLVMTHADGEGMIETLGKDIFNSPLKDASGWANAPAGAKEFSFYFCDGLVRRPALLCCNAEGIYDTVKIYRNKKETEPLCIIIEDNIAFDVVDTYNLGDKTVRIARSYHIMSIDPAGNNVRIFVSDALDIENDSVWHPKELYSEIVENVGYPPAFNSACGQHPIVLEKAMFPAWKHVGEWQAKSIVHLAKTKGYQAVFSHFHNLDAFGHTFYTWAHQRKRFTEVEDVYYQGLIEKAYVDTDDYIGIYMPLLDEGWTLFLVSDHGLLCAYEEEPPYLGDPFGVNVNVLKDLGYCVLKTDENGIELPIIDFEKTRAVSPRGNHIWINLKGRNATGIVEPEDKYELERQIISDLYNYRDSHTGKRIVSVVLRNKDAKLLGMGGEECGDIIYFLEEGFNRGHGDSLPTFDGYADTSVAPIFVACGPGIKQGYICERQIRQTDLAPTISVLMGIRMPAQNEGSIVHEILTEEF